VTDPLIAPVKVKRAKAFPGEKNDTDPMGPVQQLNKWLEGYDGMAATDSMHFYVSGNTILVIWNGEPSKYDDPAPEVA
jgi:hypothetical protein